jgi:hypothetical protein
VLGLAIEAAPAELEVSLGCLAAAGGLVDTAVDMNGLLDTVDMTGLVDTVVDMTGVVDTPKPEPARRRGRRRPAAGRRGRRRGNSKSPGIILSDSEAEVEETEAEVEETEVEVEEAVAEDIVEPEEPFDAPDVFSQLPADLPDFSLTDVCASRQLFLPFLQEGRAQASFGLAVAVERAGEEAADNRLEVETGRGVGLAVSWSGLDSYYLSLAEESLAEGDGEDSLRGPSPDPAIGLAERLEAVADVLAGPGPRVAAHCWRQQAGLLHTVTGRLPAGRPRDTAVAAWLLDPGGPAPTLARLVLDHCPRLLPLLRTLGSGPGTGSVAACPAAGRPGRHRAAAEAVLVRHLLQALEGELEAAGLAAFFQQVEMGSEAVLAQMELTGMGLHEAEFEDTRLLLQARLRVIEDRAFRSINQFQSIYFFRTYRIFVEHIICFPFIK